MHTFMLPQNRKNNLTFRWKREAKEIHSSPIDHQEVCGPEKEIKEETNLERSERWRLFKWV